MEYFTLNDKQNIITKISLALKLTIKMFVTFLLSIYFVTVTRTRALPTKQIILMVLINLSIKSLHPLIYLFHSGEKRQMGRQQTLCQIKKVMRTPAVLVHLSPTVMTIRKVIFIPEVSS